MDVYDRRRRVVLQIRFATRFLEQELSDICACHCVLVGLFLD